MNQTFLRKFLLCLYCLFQTHQSWGQSVIRNSEKIIILYENLAGARTFHQRFLKLSQIPSQFTVLKKTQNCKTLPTEMKNWDWHLVVCVNKSKKIKLLRFRREAFYANFSPFWNE